MLENVAYLGHELTEVNFEVLVKEPQGEGFYNYAVESTPDIAIKTHTAEGSNIQTIRMSFISSIKGFNNKAESDDDTPERVFDLNTKFDLLFEIEGDVPEQSFIEENQWYFVNFAHVASKEISYNIIDNSILKGAYLPSHRIGQKD